MAHPNMPEINDLASCVGGLTSHELKTRHSLSFKNNHAGTDDRIEQFIKSSGCMVRFFIDFLYL